MMTMGSTAMLSSPRKSHPSMRRTNKPLVEKKRRARINGCLGQLKSLLLSAMKTEGAQVSRLEKADILEMTVKYLRHIQCQQGSTSSLTPEPEVAAKFSAGYTECATEVIRYMDSVTGMTDDIKSRLESHLVGRLHGSVTSTTTSSSSPSSVSSATSSLSSSPSSESDTDNVQVTGHISHEDNSHPIIVNNHVTASTNEMSLHYQTAIDLANMASNIVLKQEFQNNCSVEQNQKHHHHQQQQPQHHLIQNQTHQDKLILQQQHVKETNMPVKVSSPCEQGVALSSYENQHSCNKETKSVRSVIVGRTTVPSPNQRISLACPQTSSVISTVQSKPRTSHVDDDHYRQAHKNFNDPRAFYSSAASSAPTPPDTPPNTPPQMDICDEENTNDKNDHNTNGRIIGSRMCVSFDDRSTLTNSVTNNEDIVTAGNAFLKNQTKLQHDSGRVSPSAHSIDNQNIVNSQRYSPRNTNDQLDNTMDNTLSSYAHYNSQINKNIISNNTHRRPLSSYETPLHIDIPDSPTPSSTPSPPLLLPSRPLHSTAHLHNSLYHGHSNNYEDSLPTIPYGVHPSVSATPHQIPPQNPSQYHHPPQPEAMETEATTSSAATICNLDSNCPNNGSRRREPHPSELISWTNYEKQTQIHPVQGHNNHHHHNAPIIDRSIQSPSPPKLTREDPVPATHSPPPCGIAERPPTSHSLPHVHYERTVCRSPNCEERTSFSPSCNDSQIAVRNNSRLSEPNENHSIPRNTEFNRIRNIETENSNRPSGSFQRFYSSTTKEEQTCLNLNLHQRQQQYTHRLQQQHQKHYHQQQQHQRLHDDRYNQNINTSNHHRLHQQQHYQNHHQSQQYCSINPYDNHSNVIPSSSSFSSLHHQHYNNSQGIPSRNIETKSDCTNGNRVVRQSIIRFEQQVTENQSSSLPHAATPRQNRSALLPPGTLKRVMIGQGSEVDSRPHCTDARQVDLLSPVHGHNGGGGKGHNSEKLGRVPVTAYNRSAQTQQTNMADEDRLWRPW